MVTFHSYVKLPEGIATARVVYQQHVLSSFIRTTKGTNGLVRREISTIKNQTPQFPMIPSGKLT